jgi:hypothetical protein
MQADGRITHSNWDLYDTRHCVFTPAHLTPAQLEGGYQGAYRDFYRWSNLFRSASAHESLPGQVRHLAYAGAWKKFAPVWDWAIRLKRVAHFLPVLESVLDGTRPAAARLQRADQQGEPAPEL